jgi:hypothetical protein
MSHRSRSEPARIAPTLSGALPLTFTNPEPSSAVGAIRALTIKQPWAWAVVAGHKNIENRTWTTSYRGWLIIHAGGAWDSSADRFMRRQHIDIPPNLPRGAFIGVVELTGVTYGHPSPWADRNAAHWILEQPQTFPHPIRARGQQGLWMPSHQQTAVLMAQMLQLPRPITDGFD